MSININELIFKTSQSIEILKISNDKFVVWNRYLPKLLFLNNDSIKMLELLKDNNTPYKEFVGFKRILNKFIKNNLMYSDKDDYKEKYIKSGDEYVDEIIEGFNRNMSERRSYNEFLIISNSCNLRCSYCVCEFIRNNYKENSKKSKGEKIERLINCIDKNFNAKKGNGDLKKIINFNGGEILLQKDIVKQVVDYIKVKYPNEDVSFNINTNCTLIDDNTAKFLSENFDRIAFSIDAHKEAHNQTRVYGNGKGSFNDVINGLNLLRKYQKTKDTSFQGTVIPAHDLSISKIESMKDFGFISARLGADVLNITPSEAKDMAEKCFNLAIESKEVGIWVKDSFFLFYNEILKNVGSKGEFSFYCTGLNAGYNFLHYNIDNETIKLICSFSTDTEVKLDEINNDIHHPLLYEKARDFLSKRYQIIKDNCMDCSVVSFCKGGCVMTGINPYNSINESGCAFQKETWKYFVKYLSDNKLQK